MRSGTGHAHRKAWTRFPDRLRLALGKETPRQFSRRTEIHESVLSRYLNGRVFPSFGKVCELAELLGVSVDWLMSGRGEMKAKPVELRAAAGMR